MSSRFLVRFITFIIFLFLFLLPTTYYLLPTIYADELQDQLNAKQDEITKLEQQLTETKKQANTLKSQLDIIDGQAKVTNLKIDETNLQIAKLEREITELSGRIDRISTSVDTLSEILLNRIVQTYKYSSVSTIDLLFSSHGFSDLIERLKYIQVAQANDKKVLYELQATKAAYKDQKVDKETRQAQAEKLNKDLVTYKAQLEAQRKEKDALLRITKNDEAVYQARLAAAQREINQIQRAAGILISTTPRHVNRGEVIGLMGNTGYSFGAHLHFGVYNISSLSQYDYYSNNENPANILSSQSVNWNTDCDPKGQKTTGSGSFQWPMTTSGLFISQGYGHTCYSDAYYHGNPHPAFDMYHNSDFFIRAADEGQAYTCRNCLGDGGNGIFIFHPNGKMTLYWHLQ